MKHLAKWLCLLVGIFFFSGGYVIPMASAVEGPTSKDIFMQQPKVFEGKDARPDGEEGGSEAASKFLPYHAPFRDFTNVKNENLQPGNTIDLRTAGLRSVVNIIEEFLTKFLMPVAAILILWAGTSLMVGSKDEEAFKSRRNQITGMAVGFIILAITQVTVDTAFFGDEGQILRQGYENQYDIKNEQGEVIDLTNPQDIQENKKRIEEVLTQQTKESNTFATNATRQMLGLFYFFATFGVAIATAFILYTVFRMIISGGQEDEFSKSKKRIIYSIFGIILIRITTTLVAFTTEGPGVLGAIRVPSIEGVSGLLLEWTNIFLGFVGFLSIIALVYGAILLLIGFGDDEKISRGKKVITYAIVGIILAFSAYTIVQFFTRSSLPGPENSILIESP